MTDDEFGCVMSAAIVLVFVNGAFFAGVVIGFVLCWMMG